MSSVIKMVQALRHDVMPPTLHVDQPTRAGRLVRGRDRAADRGAATWSRNGHPRRAGISSFGISGTNAHLIIEEAPAGDRGGAHPGRAQDGVVPLVVSARSAGALAGQAARLAAFLDGDR